MNSDEAAAVRDALNGCPDVLDPEPEDASVGAGTAARVDGPVTAAGECVSPDHTTQFAPAEIQQSGVVGSGGEERPVFVVVLHSLWTDTSDARTLSEQLVHELAKYGCQLRFYPPDHRLDGDVWITDHFDSPVTGANGDRCAECGGTYFKIRDGEPECARCGTPAAPEGAELQEVRAT